MDEPDDSPGLEGGGELNERDESSGGGGLDESDDLSWDEWEVE